MTKRSTAVRSDIKERRRQITEEASIESEDRVEQLAFEPAEDHEENHEENRSRAVINQSESDYSEQTNWRADMSGSQSSLLKLPTLNEDHVDEFLELEAKLKTAFDEEDCASRGGDDQGEGGRGGAFGGGGGRGGGGGGGAAGARNAILSGTKSSPSLKTRSYSLQTPILEGMMTSSPAPFFNFTFTVSLSSNLAVLNVYLKFIFEMVYLVFKSVCVVFRCIWH